MKKFLSTCKAHDAIDFLKSLSPDTLITEIHLENSHGFTKINNKKAKPVLAQKKKWREEKKKKPKLSVV